MVDPDGFRPNVGIVLMHGDGRLFWARRVNRDGWQFPQGGMNTDETPLEAMYRELREEVGLAPEHVEVLGATPGWLRYRLPRRCIRRGNRPVCIGQKQVWFLLKLTGQESDLRLDLTEKPEFDSWRWVDFWYPAEHVVSFKREVYVRALQGLGIGPLQAAAIEDSPGGVASSTRSNGSPSTSQPDALASSVPTRRPVWTCAPRACSQPPSVSMLTASRPFSCISSRICLSMRSSFSIYPSSLQ